MVFYRKYRPQKISELDSQKLQEKLFSILAKSDSIPHAFLFTGPKGLGKTSTARIVAKAINCERLTTSKLASSSKDKKLNARSYKLEADIEPCNICEQCISITNGSNMDVLEIDGASNRGIDEIRDLREKIRLSPIKAFKKIYILDEVHMLTTDAFNALLKTLEEPPDHAMFIFCTTEFHKVPATIVSRCFPISFSKATEVELINSLSRIVKGEHIKIDNEVLQLIASISENSFRDAAKILEEIVMLANGQNITKDVVEQKFKTISITRFVVDLVELLLKRDVKKSISLIMDIVEKGIDVKYLTEQLISALHKTLLANIGVGEKELQLHALSVEEIKKLIELFSKAHSELKYAVIPQLPLELAVIEYCIVSTPVILGTNGVRTPGRAPLARMTSSDLWGNFIDAVKVHNHTIAGVLRGCTLKSFDDSVFVIETAFKFHKDKLSDEKALQILEQAYEQIAGNKVRVLVQLKE